jgi:hypothetical protein
MSDRAKRHADINEMVAHAAERVREHLGSTVTVVISPLGVDKVVCDNETAERVQRFIQPILDTIDERLTETID